MRTVRLDASGQTVHLDIDPDDHIGRKLARGGWYERSLLESARERTRPGGLAVDVGAHIGNHVLWFAVACGLRVVALEPYLPSYETLRRNIALNPGVDVMALNLAVGSTAGRAVIVPPRQGNSGTVRLEVGVGDVEVVSLDSLNLTGVALLKVDVEGMAAEVLSGARAMLREQAPVVYAEGGRREIARMLPRGYRCFGEFGRTPTWGFAR